MALSKQEKQKIRDIEEFRMKVSAEHTPKVNPTHGIPALLSFFLPGIGQLVKGEIGKAILIWIAVPLGLFMLIVPGIIIWFWQTADAYSYNPK